MREPKTTLLDAPVAQSRTVHSKTQSQVSTTACAAITVAVGRFVTMGNLQLAPQPVGGILDKPAPAAVRDDASPSRHARYLTAKEVAVLEHLSEGRSHAEVGVALNIAPETARTHADRIRKKLKVRSKRALIGFRVSVLPEIPGSGGQRALAM